MIRVFTPAVFLVLMALCLSPLRAQTDDQLRQTIQVPQGPLGPALNLYALKANVTLYFDPSITNGKSTDGISGAYDVFEGFKTLLQGSGLTATEAGDGHYIITGDTSPSDNDAFMQLDVLKVQARDDRAEAMYDTPASVSVVTRDKIDRLPPRNTSDVLSSVSGVHTSQSRQDPGVSINIRGIQDFGRVNMMIDGTRQNFQKSGHGANGALYMDPQMLSGVDISKGPTSKAGGAAVIGGVVNFRTLEAEDLIKENEDQGARVRLATGTNAYHFSGNFAAAKKINERGSILAALGNKRVGEFKKGSVGGKATGKNTQTSSQTGNNQATTNYFEGVSRFTHQQQNSVLLKAQWQATENHQFKFSYIGFEAEFEDGSDFDNTAGNENLIRNDTFLTNYKWQPESDYFDFDASLYFTKTRNDQFRPESNGESSDAQKHGELDVQYEINTVGGTLTNQSLMDITNRESMLIWDVGSEFYYDWTRPEATRNTEGTGRADWFTGPTPEGDRKVASLFTQLEYAHNNGWSLMAGLRYDYFILEGDGQMRVGSIDNPPAIRPAKTDIYSNFKVARHDGFYSPTFKIAYYITDSIQLFSGYSEGVRPPSITETLMWGTHVGNSRYFFPNPDLKPEFSQSIEIGSNFKFIDALFNDDGLNLKAALFKNEVENFMVQAPIMLPSSILPDSRYSAFVNLEDKVTFSGYELQAEYTVKAFFSEMNITRTVTDLGKGGYSPYPLGSLVGYPATPYGSQEAGIMYVPSPEIKASWSNGVRLFDQTLTLGFRIRMEDNGGRGGTSYEDIVGWQVYDLWGSYEPRDWLTLNLSVDNIEDRNYAELNGTSYWVAPGRTAVAALTVKL